MGQDGSSNLLRRLNFFRELGKFNQRQEEEAIRYLINRATLRREVQQLEDRYREIGENPTDWPVSQEDTIEVAEINQEELGNMVASIEDSYSRSRSKLEKMGLLRFTTALVVARELKEVNLQILDEIFGFGDGSRNLVQDKANYASQRKIIIRMLERLNGEA